MNTDHSITAAATLMPVVFSLTNKSLRPRRQL